jgi:hypothetical protein
MLPAPLQFIVAMFAYALNARVARKMEYLQEEVRVLKEVGGDRQDPDRTERRAAAAPGAQGQGADRRGTPGLLPDRAPGDYPRLVSPARRRAADRPMAATRARSACRAPTTLCPTDSRCLACSASPNEASTIRWMVLGWSGGWFMPDQPTTRAEIPTVHKRPQPNDFPTVLHVMDEGITQHVRSPPFVLTEITKRTTGAGPCQRIRARWSECGTHRERAPSSTTRTRGVLLRHRVRAMPTTVTASLWPSQ